MITLHGLYYVFDAGSYDVSDVHQFKNRAIDEALKDVNKSKLNFGVAALDVQSDEPFYGTDDVSVALRVLKNARRAQSFLGYSDQETYDLIKNNEDLFQWIQNVDGWNQRIDWNGVIAKIELAEMKKQALIDLGIISHSRSTYPDTSSKYPAYFMPPSFLL